MTRFLVTLMVVAGLVLGAAAYARAGWPRMEDECTRQAMTEGRTLTDVGFSLDGFTCRWADGTTTSSWWF